MPSFFHVFVLENEWSSQTFFGRRADFLTTKRNLNHATESNTEIYKGMTIEDTGSTSSSSGEWIHNSTILSKRKQTTDKSSEPSLHSEVFVNSPAESVKKRKKTNAVPPSIDMPVIELEEEAKLSYYNCISQARIIEEGLNTYQGRNKVADINGQISDSSNGCVVISILIANEHMVSESALTNDQIEFIIDYSAVCWLPQVRQECDADHESHVNPWLAIDFFQEEERKFFQDCTTKADPATGNILDDCHLNEFINLMKEDEKCAGILYFKRHEISILQNKDASGTITYNIIDSLPLPNGNAFAPRTTCKDSKSLFIALRYHAYKYLFPEDLDFIESTPWDENNQLAALTDPRIFQGYVWRKSSNGPDSTPPSEAVSMPPLLDVVSTVEFNGKTCLKLTRNFKRYLRGTKKRLVNKLSAKSCENEFPGVKIKNAKDQPNKGFVTVDFFGDDENTIRNAADYLSKLVENAIDDYEYTCRSTAPPEVPEQETSAAAAVPPVVHDAEQTHVDDVPSHADASHVATRNDVREDVYNAIEAASSIEPVESNNNEVPSFSRASTPKIDNLCCPSSEKDDAIQACDDASLDEEILEQAIRSVHVNASQVVNMEVDLAMPGLGPPEDDDTSSSASPSFEESNVDDCAAIDGVGNEFMDEAAAFASSFEDTLPMNNVARDVGRLANRDSLESSDTSVTHSSTNATYAKMFPLYFAGDRNKPLINDDTIDFVHKTYPSVRVDRLTHSLGLDFRDDDEPNGKEMDEAIKYLSKEVQKQIDTFNADCVLKSGPMCLQLDVKIDLREADRTGQRIDFKECERTYTKHGVWLHRLDDNHPLSTVLGSSTFTYILISKIKVGHNWESIDSKKRYKELREAIEINNPVVIFRLNVHRDSDLSQIKSDYIESDEYGLRCGDGTTYKGKDAAKFRKERPKPKKKSSKRKGSRTSKKAKPSPPSAKRLRIPLATDHTSNDRLSENLRKKLRKHK
ncbi:hypothetical protein CTEN210_06717 [Chaetoceros tenuissimus]|uniref:Uncharacterized protein n=1 Tax=Chaetoceros tenuissimus TaxID=426638 RepID=A0AAD3CS80_9STRA|nr:hypothetical protein CTEN210_06717 [Chaetoceros tenuissimus]